MPEPLIRPKGDGPRFGKNLPKPRIVEAPARCHRRAVHRQPDRAGGGDSDVNAKASKGTEGEPAGRRGKRKHVFRLPVRRPARV